MELTVDHGREPPSRISYTLDEALVLLADLEDARGIAHVPPDAVDEYRARAS